MVEIAVLINYKANTIIIIDGQPLQHPFSLVLLQISITLPTFPIPTLAKTNFLNFLCYYLNKFQRYCRLTIM